jgi:hypothetical protein
MLISLLLLTLSLFWTLPFVLRVSATTIPTENNTVVTRFTAATFNNHRGVSLSSDGVFALVAETYSQVIRHITLSTTVVTTLAGYSGTTGTADGFGTDARFNYPYGVSIAPTNDYALVADSSNFLIRHITLPTAEVTTFAGSVLGDVNGIGTSAQFGLLYGIAISPDGLYAFITSNSWEKIQKIVLSTKQVWTIAGSGTAGNSNGIGTFAQFQDPYGISISSDGSFALVAEVGNQMIRKIVIPSYEVTTLAGTAQSSGSGNGVGTSVLFNGPNGVSISPGGDYALVTDTDNDVIRLIVLSTGEVSTIAGVVGSTGSSDGQGTNVHFNSPRAVAILPDGYSALVADSWNGYMRKLQFPTPPTSLPTLAPSLLPTISPLPTKVPTTRPSTIPTDIPTTQPSSSPTLAPSSSPSPKPIATLSTATPTSSPTLGPILLRHIQCKASPLEPFNSCSFILCPNQDMVLTIAVPSDDGYYYSSGGADDYLMNPQSRDEIEIHRSPLKEKLHSRYLGEGSLVDDDSTTVVVKLLDSKENVLGRYNDGYQFSYTYDVSTHFCDVMTITQKCTVPQSCPLQLDISIFQSREFPTLLKYSFGLVFNDTEHNSDPFTAPATSYYFDGASSKPYHSSFSSDSITITASPSSDSFFSL